MLWATEKADENISLVPIGSLNVLSCPCFVLVRRSVQPGKYFTQYPQCNLNLFMTLSYQSFFQVWENQHHEVVLSLCWGEVLRQEVGELLASVMVVATDLRPKIECFPFSTFVDIETNMKTFSCLQPKTLMLSFSYISKSWWASGKCDSSVFPFLF